MSTEEPIATTERSRDRATKIIAEINRCRHEIKALYRDLSEVMPDEGLHGLPARSQIARELNMSRDLVIGMESSGVWHHYGWGFEDTDCGLSVENMVVVRRDGRRVCKSCLKAT
jgi:hypothetical protein